MTAIHEFECDICNKKVPAKYNGEHWLPPVGWAYFTDSETEKTEGHMCEKCRPKPKKVKVPK